MTKVGAKISVPNSVKRGAFFPYGAELVTNGGFDTDTDWEKQTGWTISAGTANAVATTGWIRQIGILEIGKTYLVEFTITSYTAGSVRAVCGSTGVGTSRISTGTYVEEIVCSGDTNFYLDGVASLTCSVDNVSVREKLI